MKLSEASEALRRIGLSRYVPRGDQGRPPGGNASRGEGPTCGGRRETNHVLMARGAKFVPLRRVDRQRARFIIVDRDSILGFLIQDEKSIRGEGETAQWTNSPDFVKAHLEFFEKSWASGTVARRRLAELRGP